MRVFKGGFPGPLPPFNPFPDDTQRGDVPEMDFASAEKQEDEERIFLGQEIEPKRRSRPKRSVETFPETGKGAGMDQRSPLERSAPKTARAGKSLDLMPGSQDWVKGIILSEILGPPRSRRSHLSGRGGYPGKG